MGQCHDRAAMSRSRLPGPGPAKVRGAPLILRRYVELVATSEGRLRELFEVADVISEGSAREEDGRLVYYGSTSLLIRPGEDAATVAQLGRLLPFDPHVRIRALRIAHREASSRAGGPIGTLHAELSFGDAAQPAQPAQAAQPAPGDRARLALALTVDVSAVVLTRGARTTSG